jgi:beta-glucuronidase
MLRPIENEYRDYKLLNGIWRFCLDTDDNLCSKPWTARLPGKAVCPVPASYNDIFAPAIRRHVGKVWYQREITIPKHYTERVVLRLDSATHTGEVYCNNSFIVKHVGGYMPFEADLSKHVQPGDTVRITIGVSNVLTNETIPPGIVSTNELGVKELTYLHDFYNYAGLARSIRLCSIPHTYIKDVTVKTEIDDLDGIVTYKVDVEGDGNVEVELQDEDGKVVGSAKGHKGRIEVEEARLWEPLNAYLYTLTARVTHHGIVDEYKLAIGIRTVKVDGYDILINGKPVYLKGFGRHEDTPVRYHHGPTNDRSKGRDTTTRGWCTTLNS